MRYCKSTIFQANHNPSINSWYFIPLFAILQKYDFSSKSQHKRTNNDLRIVVCDTAKVRFFKQITTNKYEDLAKIWLFAILQKYDFSSKSQLDRIDIIFSYSCLRYCKSTIFQANHNTSALITMVVLVVCDTAKVRFFKQITTTILFIIFSLMLFAILQKYDFSSKSQRMKWFIKVLKGCLRYCKSTIFQANHNKLRYRNAPSDVVCDTAKVRFFKQITTKKKDNKSDSRLFAILQKYDFSSKSQR